LHEIDAKLAWLAPKAFNQLASTISVILSWKLNGQSLHVSWNPNMVLKVN
jgi:hypothetical protein